jgi:hypothetical protein
LPCFWHRFECLMSAVRGGFNRSLQHMLQLVTHNGIEKADLLASLSSGEGNGTTSQDSYVSP